MVILVVPVRLKTEAAVANPNVTGRTTRNNTILSVLGRKRNATITSCRSLHMTRSHSHNCGRDQSVIPSMADAGGVFPSRLFCAVVPTRSYVLQTDYGDQFVSFLTSAKWPIFLSILTILYTLPRKAELN